MACDSRGLTRENGDYPVTINEIIRSPRYIYQVLDVLGRGTFGQVLKAWRPDTGQLVALKVLKNIPSYTKQGQLEVDVLSRLSSHAAYEYNIVQAYESFSHSGHICISFELLETNLYDYLKQNRFQPLALKHIRPIAQQVLCCLQRLRELGLVHSDIKPENIMLVDQGRWPYRVKVIDFGSATSVSTCNATSYLQSRYYRAPEVILSLPYTEAIDMWSLGCVLAELFLGWPLFPGANEYDQISFIVSTLGNPPNNMLRNIRKACKFFSINRYCNQWALKPPHQVKAESGVVSKETRKYIFTSLSDLMRFGSHDNHSVVYKLDCEQFVKLLAKMLTFDPASRSSPSQALQSPYITMQHLATHTADYSVREWIQCMHVCRLSRTTNSSPLTEALIAHSHPLYRLQQPTGQSYHVVHSPALTGHAHRPPALIGNTNPLQALTGHTHLPPALTGHTHPPPALTGHTHPPPALTGHTHPPPALTGHPHPPGALTGHTHPPPALTGLTHPPPALTGHPHPPGALTGHSLLLPSSNLPFFVTPHSLFSCPPPLPYHLSPIAYHPYHSEQKSSHSSATCEDTGYGSADSSPTTPHHSTEHVDLMQAQVVFHAPHVLPSSHSSLPHSLTTCTSHHQLYSLCMAHHLHVPTATQSVQEHSSHHPPDTLHMLAPHHPFSRL